MKNPVKINAINHDGENWVISTENKNFVITDKKTFKDNIIVKHFIAINLFGEYLMDLWQDDDAVWWDAIIHNTFTDGIIFVNLQT